MGLSGNNRVSCNCVVDSAGQYDCLADYPVSPVFCRRMSMPARRPIASEPSHLGEKLDRIEKAISMLTAERKPKTPAAPVTSGNNSKGQTQRGGKKRWG